MTLSDGSVLDSPEAVHQGAIRYFQEFLAGDRVCADVDLSSILEGGIYGEDNDALCCPLEEDEVKNALGSIPIHSSPGPDGFGSRFYLSCWELVKGDLVESAKDIFSGD